MFRLLSRVAISVGLISLGLKLLLASLERLKIGAVVVNMDNTITPLESEPNVIKVVYEDKEALKELGDLYVTDFVRNKSTYDVN